VSRRASGAKGDERTFILRKQISPPHQFGQMTYDRAISRLRVVSEEDAP